MTSPIETNNVVERLPPKFRARVEICSDGCWRWSGSLNSQGYGCYYDGKRFLAHRVAYQLLVGPIPSHLCCDHLCSVRNCVNPAHIELVTPGENASRGHQRREREGRTAPWTQTHCRKGHEFTPENTLMHHRGRTCHTCQIASMRRYRERTRPRITPERRREIAIKAARARWGASLTQGGNTNG